MHLRRTIATLALVSLLVGCAQVPPAPTAVPAPTQVAATDVPPMVTPSSAAVPPSAVPEPTEPPPTATPAPTSATAAADPLQGIHWLGHASFCLTSEKVVYVDPWELTAAAPPQADIIIITHGHSDHCSPGDVAKISGPQTTVLAPVDCAHQLGGQVQTITPGQELTVQGVAIETVQAYNLDKSFHPEEASYVGYVVTLDGVRIYHAGDTDLTEQVAGVRADVALLPVDGEFNMTAEQAADAANTIKPKVAVPMHWGRITGSHEDAERFQRLSRVKVEILEQEK